MYYEHLDDRFAIAKIANTVSIQPSNPPIAHLYRQVHPIAFVRIKGINQSGTNWAFRQHIPKFP